jgi:addiction module HigA family antidote
MEHLELIPPGEILLEEFLDPLGISQNKLARDIDVPVGRINEIIRRKRAITADTALRLAKFFGTTPEFWLNLQTDYDLRKARRESWPQIEPRVHRLKAA